MKTRPLILAAALAAPLVPHAAAAQSPDAQAVMAVVNRMFDGMRAADSAVVRAAFASGARFAMIDARTQPAGVRYDTVGGWINGIAGSARRWDEQLYDVQVHVDGDMAQVWAPYTFYLDKKWRHCGINAISLLKDAAGWKITQLSDTRRRESCRDPHGTGPAAPPPTASAPSQARTQNVILVVTDGLRWQEVFGGADSLLVFGDPRVLGDDTLGVRGRFWRATATERRETLLPFFWGTIAREGQIFGNRGADNSVAVTNGLKFSYPGYHEMLAGFVDPRIDKNEFGVNPNATVFEWLNKQPGFTGRVAAFATWDVFADIFARQRSGVFVHAGWEPPYATPRHASDSLLNTLYATTFRMWGNNAWDSFTHAAAMRYLAERRPRVLFLGFGETDEWAHAGRYDRYLAAARAVDRYIAELWATVQAHPEYRGRTSLIVATDHGRGRTTRDWTSHGRTVDGAEEMWIAVIGPDTPGLHERRNAPAVTQSQIAATVAALLGLDYGRDVPRAARPIADAIRP